MGHFDTRQIQSAESESRPFQLKDGDILQLGVVYHGGAKDIYTSVKVRLEFGREWQTSANALKCNIFFTSTPNADGEIDQGPANKEPNQPIGLRLLPLQHHLDLPTLINIIKPQRCATARLK